MKKNDLKKLLAIGAAVTAAAAVTAVAVTIYNKNKKKAFENEIAASNKNVYIAGGGLSALASALYLIRDCGLKPSNVHVFINQTPKIGDSENGYICRRGKIISTRNSMNLFELLSGVNSTDIPDLTVCEEILNIYRSNPLSRPITFIDEDKNVIDISKIKLDKEHRKIIMQLMQSDNAKLKSMPMFESFDSKFFQTPFWKLFSSAYGYSKDDSTYEFINCLAHFDNMMSGTIPDDFDRYEEIVIPLKSHLEKIGADISSGCEVTDIDFEDDNVSAVHYTDNGIRKTVYLNDGDLCILPTDDMAYGESFGSFNEPAPKLLSTPYMLWKKLSEKNHVFKDPSLFFSELDENMSEEFTITLSNSLLPELIDKVTCGALGNDGIIVLDNSNWKFTVCAVPSTHFKNTKEDIRIMWGSATRFDRDGERCGKPMTECSGAEILYELVSCFNLDEAWDDIRESVINVIPCHRRFDHSFVAPGGSKLEIIPTGIGNMAVSGDFAEYENGTVFSQEYAVSTARSAAYTLMKTKEKVFKATPFSCRKIKKFLKNSLMSL